MSRVVVVPDDEDVGAAALDVTDVVAQLWETHQHLIHDGNTPLGTDDPDFDQFRAFAGLPTQGKYEAERRRQFLEHSEWLDRMRRTNWGMTSEEGL